MPPSTLPTNTPDKFSFKDATREEVLEDLSSRFILNLPDEELSSIERICFQVEQAHWFYEDFVRDENPSLPSLPLKKFSAMLFHACPLLRQWSADHEQAFNNFMQYKTRVPVCGAIMLNGTWEKCVLVKGWKSNSGWGFPKGKINQDETEWDCAIREVLEETGYDLSKQLRRKDNIKLTIREQRITLFVVGGIPEDYEFQTRTRKEISKIDWFKLTDLPTWKKSRTSAGKFYLISPFIGPLKDFIEHRKSKPPPAPKGNRRRKEHQAPAPAPSTSSTTPSHSQPSVIDNLFARIEEPAPPPAPAPAAAEDADPHVQRLIRSLYISDTSTTSASTQTSPSHIHSPAQSITSPKQAKSPTHLQSPMQTPNFTDLRGTSTPQVISPPSQIMSTPSHALSSTPSPRDTPKRAPQIPTPPASTESSSESHSPLEGDFVQRRQRHLALLESVSEELTRPVSAHPAPTQPLRPVPMQAPLSARGAPPPGYYPPMQPFQPIPIQSLPIHHQPVYPMPQAHAYAHALPQVPLPQQHLLSLLHGGPIALAPAPVPRIWAPTAPPAPAPLSATSASLLNIFNMGGVQRS